MNRTFAVITGAAAAVLLATSAVSGCSSGKSSSPASSSPTSNASPSAPAGNAAVVVRSTALGPILAGQGGRALYLFAADATTRSTCYGACAAAWPPVTVNGTPGAGRGVTAGLLGTTKRSDGTTQVTYKGHPLYYYVGDTKAGDTTGRNITQYGAKWYVLNTSGAKVGG